MTRYYTKNREEDPREDNSISKLVLTKDNWNDYGFETTFFLDFFDRDGFHEIGLVRILHVEAYRTRDIIPDEFSSLNKDFVSLGMNSSYYESMIDFFDKKLSLEILKSLNDISVSKIEVDTNFDLNHEGIQNSFFRSSDGRYLYEEVNNLYFINKETLDRAYNFSFLTHYEENELNIEIDFSEYYEVPNRLFAIIGKNGVGKTRFLNQLASALYDSSNPKNKNRFFFENKNEIPIYQKVIAISYSIFDDFFKGVYKDDSKTEESEETDETKFANYTYIGMQGLDNEFYSRDRLIEINQEAYKVLMDEGRIEEFIDMVKKSNILQENQMNNISSIDFFNNKFSSGQNIFVSLLCRLLSNLKHGSLIFLDEPELYLHPNAIANLMNIFNNLLSKYKSYAILCTHSPILVQEIPSKFVRNLLSVDGVIVQSKISMETFGANISDINRKVYDVQENESLYKTTLKDLSAKYEEKKIHDLFNNELSLKASLYLSTMYDSEG